MKTIPIFLVDAFANEPFKGNPAGVVVLDQPADAVWMQKVAMEMNQTETAFIVPQEKGFCLRWFTPTVEVDLCGHATLASAHILWETDRLQLTATARFHTKSGLLTARRAGDWIELDFPAVIATPAEAPAELTAALGAPFIHCARNKFDYLIELESESAVRRLQPDHAKLRSLPVRGVIVTAGGMDYDIVSRFFAPGSGVDEDPVTGSAHCALAPYWSQKLGKTSLTAFQASPRGGVLNLRLEGDRVILCGQAVTTLKGELLA